MKQLVKRTLQGKPAQNRTIERKFARFLLDVVKGRRKPGEVFPLMTDTIWRLGGKEGGVLNSVEMALVCKEGGAHHLSSVLIMERERALTEEPYVSEVVVEPPDMPLTIKFRTRTQPMERLTTFGVDDKSTGILGIKASSFFITSLQLELDVLSFEEFKLRIQEYLRLIRNASIRLKSLKEEEIIHTKPSLVVELHPNREL